MRLPRSLLLGLGSAVLLGSAALLATEWALDDARARIRADDTATAQRAADSTAQEVSKRVIGPQSALASAAQGLLVQYGAARKDKAVLSGILADLRPLIGPAEDIQYVFAIDQSGALLAADPPAPELLAAALIGGPWSTQAREGRSAVSDVYPSALQGSPAAVVVAVPVRDGFGQPAGALAAAVDVSRAGDWASGLTSSGTTTRLFDQRGQAIGGAPGTGAAGAVTGTSRIAGLGWRVEVAIPPARIDHELAPISSASRILVLALALMTLLAVTAMASARASLRREQAGAAQAREAVVLANRQRALFLDRFGQSLRAPLNSIVGFSGLLEEQLADTGFAVPERRWLRNIRDETAQLVSLTSDACDLSLFDSGDIELHTREIGIGELMTPVEDAAAAAATAREVTLDHAVGEGVVSLDVERVRRIAGAVVDRAIRRAPPGGRVVLSARRADNMFELAVESAGVGLPAERIGAVREALGGLPDPSDTPGAGLALAVAARMATLHGGSISYFESEARTGSFQVRIPSVA